MSRYFMYATSLEGIEQLAVECINHASGCNNKKVDILGFIRSVFVICPTQ